MRGIRDQALLLDGLHLIVMGTTDAVRTVVQRHTHVRSMFSAPVVLDPLVLPEVHKLLEHRYQALQLDPDKSWHRLRPRGEATAWPLPWDLRGMLKSLEDGLQDRWGSPPWGMKPVPSLAQQDWQFSCCGRKHSHVTNRCGKAVTNWGHTMMSNMTSICRRIKGMAPR